MGEDFLRKQTENFIRTRNRRLQKLLENNIFSNIAPSECMEAIGILCGNPEEPKTLLWPLEHKDGSIGFFAGQGECVRFPPARAAALRDLVRGGMIVGMVRDCDLDLGHVRLQIIPVDTGR